MFKNEGKGKTREPLPMNGITRIPTGTAITSASLVSVADIRIDGTVNGSVMTDGKVVIGEGGVLAGDLVCCNADISGTVTGKVTAAELATLTATCVLKGDISSNKLCIENGATFEGTCRIIDTGQFEALRDEFKKNLSE